MQRAETRQICQKSGVTIFKYRHKPTRADFMQSVMNFKNLQFPRKSGKHIEEQKIAQKRVKSKLRRKAWKQILIFPLKTFSAARHF